MLLRIAKFAESGVRRVELEAAFGVNRSTVRRAVKRLRSQGEAGFFAPRRGRGRSVLDAATVREADRLLASELSGAAVARRLGIAVSTFSHNRRAGVVGGEAVPARPGASVDRGARDARDREAPMGRGARDTAGRQLAAAGLLSEAEPRFEEAMLAVAGGGVLAGLPMLLREGLLDGVRPFLRLPSGFYGLASVLLFLAFLVLARVRNPEALRHQAPGEWGAILGLNRCPEAKILSRKVRALGHDAQRVRDWQSSLAEAWLAGDPEACATLCVDGHVKIYSGRKGKLPKHFVARQKLCLPASTSYWINALGGKPFLCLNKALDPTMTHALEAGILPALEALGALPADAPDLTAPAPGEPALALVFDREGWSPALFRRLARRGVAVITWHKGFKGENWPEQDFRAVAVPTHGPGGTRKDILRLAEKRVELADGFAVRQIRRLLDGGRQVPLITTDPGMPMERVAGALFSRWSQENFFKYIREEFNLDAIPIHALEPQDPDARVTNPLWRKLNGQIQSDRRRLGTLRNRIADLRRGNQTARVAKDAARLEAESNAIHAQREALKEQRKATPRHITVSQLDEHDKLHALPEGEKLLLDIIRMIAYRAETRMMPAITNAQGTKPNPGRHLRALLSSEADIIPEPDNGILRVRILGTASEACDKALDSLIEELNQTRTIYPGTKLRMVYELPRNPTASEPAASTKMG